MHGNVCGRGMYYLSMLPPHHQVVSPFYIIIISNRFGAASVSLGQLMCAVVWHEWLRMLDYHARGFSHLGPLPVDRITDTPCALHTDDQCDACGLIDMLIQRGLTARITII